MTKEERKIKVGIQEGFAIWKVMREIFSINTQMGVTLIADVLPASGGAEATVVLSDAMYYLLPTMTTDPETQEQVPVAVNAYPELSDEEAKQKIWNQVVALLPQVNGITVLEELSA